MAAALERRTRMLIVKRMRRRDDDGIKGLPRQHLLIVFVSCLCTEGRLNPVKFRSPEAADRCDRDPRIRLELGKMERTGPPARPDNSHSYSFCFDIRHVHRLLIAIHVRFSKRHW